MIVDVAIIGGGVVGLFAAALFGACGCDVALIEPSVDDAAPSGPIGIRTYAIAPGAARALAHVGAWQRLDPGRIGHFDRMSVWDAGSRGRLEFEPPLVHEGPMGYIVEHQHLVHVLAAVVTSLPCVRRTRATFGALAAGAPTRLSLSTGVTIQARLVLGADGANSAVREAAGIEVRRKPYGERALVCNVEFAVPHANVARQRFLAGGPIASLPLHEPHSAAIVWTLPAQAAEELLQADAKSVARAVTAACEATPGTVTRVGPRAAYTLERLTAERMVAEHSVLLGDAAHVVHPLAGQGLNLGLMDVAALYECLDAGAAARGAYPSRLALRRFERWRKSETAAMSLVIEALHALFARDERPLRTLRGLGLELTSRARPVARWLAAQAMGEAGEVPRLARFSYSDRGAARAE